MDPLDALAAVAGVVLLIAQLAQVGLLAGVFFRLGSMKATQAAHDGRLERIEGQLRHGLDK